ncbi:MAG TPA: hypothetical protein VFF72_11130 [Caldimonas sp.]|nr:hypothetical protein [Caldimonas sp.]
MKIRSIPSTRGGWSPIVFAGALAGALACPWAMAQGSSGSAMTPQAQYAHDRAACESGRTTEDKATCLKEAGAALDARRHDQLTSDDTPLRNATDRCRMLPRKDQADCVARIVGPLTPNQRVTVSGSVAGGGDIKETTTTTPGSVIVVVPEAPKK